jgi:acetyltransferase-like isoleucine patch superfamily enzyme
MIAFLNHIISKGKKEKYALDPAIPPGYLLQQSVRRGLMLVSGFFSAVHHEGWLFLSPSAKLRCSRMLHTGRFVTIESGASIDALSSEGIIFGNNVSVGKNTRITGTGHLGTMGKGMRVGNNVGLGTNSFYGCGGGIIIGGDTIIGDFVSFHAENHECSNLEIPIRLQGVRRNGISIGNNCWIGSKATILDGAVVEDGCVIAAGAVVRKGIYQANGIYGGVPARLIKMRGTNA